MNNRNLALSFLIGLVFSSLALYLTFKNIPLWDLFEYLKQINYWWIIPSLIIALISFLIRVVRWQIILEPVRKTTFFESFHPLMIGFMINSVLPGRVGELVRPATYAKKEGVPFFSVFATVGAERSLDIATLLLFSIFFLSTTTINPSIDLSFGSYHLNKGTLEMIWVTTIRICFALLAFILLISIDRTRAAINRLLLHSVNFVPFAGTAKKERIRELCLKKVTDSIDHLAQGFAVLRNPFKLFICAILSMLVWLMAALSFYVLTFGCPGIDVSFQEMCAVMVIICFFISLPSVPGYWGLFEAGGVFGLMVFGIEATDGAGFIITNHVVQILPIIIIGLVSMMIVGIHFGASLSQIPRK